MRCALLLSGILASPVAADPLTLVPRLDTELRYEQYVADRLLGEADAVQLRALPGVTLSAGPWSLGARSNAAIRIVGRDRATAPRAPEAIGLDEFMLRYTGLPHMMISVGRQRLGMAGAALTGDRDGAQTFDAARIRWSGLRGLSADLAFAWASSSMWAEAARPVPTVLPGDSVFAELNWTSRLGTLSGYAYQVDQRPERSGQFRLLNQVFGTRFRGSSQVDEVRLAYSLSYVRQLGSVANLAGGAPTYWQIGNNLDLGDLTATHTSYRRFAANGITALNGDTMNLATSANIGRLTVGAAYSDFRPLPDAGATIRDLRLSLGLTF